MHISIREHAEQHVEAVARFNGRLRAGGERTQFPTSPVPKWLPKLDGRRIFQQHYLVLDDLGEVRGAYILKHQDVWIRDQVVAIADLHLPISEGAVNRNYPHVGVQLLRDAIRKQPLLFGLGMGGYGEALARLFAAAGWSMFSVPFYFRILRPTKFLRNIVNLRRRPGWRLPLNILAATRLGSLGIHTAQAIRSPRTRCDPAVAMEVVEEFSEWTDDLWESRKGQYGMCAVRDSETLRILYPASDPRFIRLKITRQQRTIGWAVLLDTQLVDHNHFGNMRLGSIVDCFSATTDALPVVCAARECLEARGVDLIVSNQSNAAWGLAFRQAGFLQGPTNFIFTSSPKLTELLLQKSVKNEELHFNRGDGDGPINL
jgi:hypothetical protein